MLDRLAPILTTKRGVLIVHDVFDWYYRAPDIPITAATSSAREWTPALR